MDLGKILEGKSNVSSGNIIGFEYDKSKADLTQAQPEIDSISKRLPYVRRAINYAEKFGYDVLEDSFRHILIARTQGKLVLTIREADIAYRKKMQLNSLLLIKAFTCYDVILTEDDSSLTAGVFQLRHRYNKGIEWRKIKRSMQSKAEQEAGDRKIEEIDDELSSLGLPLHDEERIDGFDREFMKLEWMNWSQFTTVIQAARNRMTKPAEK